MTQWPHLGLYGEFSLCEDGIIEAINSNFELLDSLVQLSVIDIVSELPDSDLTEGDIYILETDGSINVWDGGDWFKIDAQHGFVAYLKSVNSIYGFDGSSWINLLEVEVIATNVSFNNSGTGLSANNVQDAIVELSNLKQNKIITTQGDLVVGDASGDPVRLPIGTEGQLPRSVGGEIVWTDEASIFNFITEDTTLSVPSEYIDINAALLYLSDYRIINGATVTIQVADGSYAYSSTINLDHPDSVAIEIIGNEVSPALCSLSFTAINGFYLQNGSMFKKISGFSMTSSAWDSFGNWNTYSTSAISCTNGSSMEVGNLILEKFYYGLRAANSSFINVTGPVDVSNSGDGGFFCYNGSSMEINALTTSTTAADFANSIGFGYIAELGSSMRFGVTGCSANNNDISGFFSNMNGTILGSGLISSNNGRHGFEIERNSCAEVRNASTSGNNNDGLWVANYSYALTTGFSGQNREAGPRGYWE